MFSMSLYVLTFYKVLLLRSVSHMITDWYTGSFVILWVVSWKNKFWCGHALRVFLSRWWNGEESTFQCRRLRRCGFNPWVRNISLRRKRHPTPSSILARKISWTEESGELHSMGSQRVGLSTLACELGTMGEANTFLPCLETHEGNK